MLWVLYSKFQVILSFAAHLVSFNKLHQRHFTEKNALDVFNISNNSKTKFLPGLN